MFSRRLGRAIDWLDLAWLNATGLTDDLRIPALRAGFEVLLDSDRSMALAGRLSDLLSDESPAIQRSWVLDDSGRQDHVRSANGLGLVVHAFLVAAQRPDARTVARPRYVANNGRVHTDLGEWYLRQAVKHTVTNDGHPDIRDPLLWRSTLRNSREWWRAHHTRDPDSV
jgi:hypothetical protein